MSRNRFLTLAALILLAGAALRVAWLRADPPTYSVGIVWHDEGAWTHSARNQVLWGAWQTDRWNPVYLTPVFTGLEYVAFKVFGVGTWQARSVPVASGLVALAAMMMGLAALWGSRVEDHGRRVALIGGALLSVNFTWVMWNRAALMESTMTAFIVIAWAAYCTGERRPTWGLVAGVATVLAFFTKASAAFFVAAIVADAFWVIAADRLAGLRTKLGLTRPEEPLVRTAWLTLAGIGVAGLFIGLYFVIPYWHEVRFYNWQMSVERKPSYTLMAFKDRASYLLVSHDFFSRMWFVVLGAVIAIAGIAARWRESKPGERLLVLWVLIGFLELIVHDAGNERRYVMFVPAIVALASGLAGSGMVWLPAYFARPGWQQRALAAPLILLLGLIVVAAALRLVFHEDIAARHYSLTIRLSAAIVVGGTAIAMAFWQQSTAWLAARRVPLAVGVTLATILVAWDLGQYARWAQSSSDLNYRASLALGVDLPPGTTVQGKLANGLALENRIRPIFVGRGFGNYEDRFDRNDARYILTYGLPAVGFESQPGLIQEILDRYPNRRVIDRYQIDETPGADEAWLIEKSPPATLTAAAPGHQRAPD
ncbi:MAG TPA: glycosyltransferase family 39 protein [Vicinamibacterales bacterium]|nr:glycosyltransferase family 39 protein [Vicinamibacterales bacterium]